MAWDATRLPVPSDVLVYTAEECERLGAERSFVRDIMHQAVWVYPDGMEPKVVVEAGARTRGSVPGDWTFDWHIRNVGNESVTLCEAWQPHGQFRGPRTKLAEHLVVAPGSSVRIELPVACAEPPGTVVQNAFVILRMQSHGEPWRILARLTITIDVSGGPVPATEDITVQRIGFSREGQ
jgi:hypothetical protein